MRQLIQGLRFHRSSMGQQVDCFHPKACIGAKHRTGANDRTPGNNCDQTGATVYAATTFYWTDRPRQRHIRFQSVPQLCIPADATHNYSPKCRRNIAIGGEDGCYTGRSRSDARSKFRLGISSLPCRYEILLCRVIGSLSISEMNVFQSLSSEGMRIVREQQAVYIFSFYPGICEKLFLKRKTEFSYTTSCIRDCAC